MSSRQYTLDTSGPRWRFRETEASKLRNEREQEAREYRRQFRSPRARRILLAIAALLALLPALIIWSLWHVPTEEEARVATVSQAPATFVDDPADLLTPAQEQDLLRGAEALPHPSTVTRLRFIVFDDSLDNVNDSVENFMRDTYPAEIGPDHFADGTLLVGAAMETRHQFIFAGEDVADQLALRSGSHLDASLEAMTEGLRANDIPRGLLDGTRYATDPERVYDYKFTDARLLRALVPLPVGGGVFAFALVIGGVPVRRVEKRKQRIAEARRDKDLLTREHTALALRLDEIDKRARSVDSRFVDGELRAQWQQVSDRFLELDHAVRDLPVALDSDALANATALADAAQTLEDAQRAEEHIDALYRMERGDVAVRQARLAELHDDATHARDAAAKAGDEVLAEGLDRISNRFHALAANPEDASFMDTFVRVLGDYQTSMEVLQARHFAARKGVDDYEAPRLWEPDFRYPGYVSYHELSLWDATSNSPSTGSGTNSGFSSGFSGSGGSSSF